jgi:hypothetical protein
MEKKKMTPSSKVRSAEEQWLFMEELTKIWQLFPEKSFGLFISEIMKNPNEIYVIKDKDLLKRLQKENLP